ncbi:MAG TPA: 2-hydroxyglutaryl-CoA dehydratase, partial [Minicystis sp.]|nr:2-hydroxyglutaryl-CoA dehydratase [Minicystis sp.]
GAAAAAVRAAVAATPGAVSKAIATARDPEVRERLREDWELLRDLLAGKAKERFAPLVKRLASKAYFENNREVHAVTQEPIAAE